MPHREDISAYLKKINIQDGVVIDWGCGGKPVSGKIQMGDRVQYYSYDKNPKSKAKRILDFEMESLPDDQPQADYVFCIEVLEHTQFPHDVIGKIAHYLKSGTGILYLSVPFLFPVHNDDDYWRFTDIGLRMILNTKGFNVDEIVPTENNSGWIVKATKDYK